MKRLWYNWLISLKEFKSNSIIIILCAFISTGLFAVSYTILSSAIKIPSSFRNEILNNNSNMLIVNLLDYDNFQVDKLRNDGVIIVLRSQSITSHVNIASENTSLFIHNYNSGAAVFFENNSMINVFFSDSILYGTFGDYNDNNMDEDGYYGIWLANNIAEELDVNIGDLVEYNYGEHLKVKGIYNYINESLPIFYIPYNFAVEKIVDDSKIKISLYIWGGENIYNNLDKLTSLNISMIDNEGYSSLFLSVKYIGILLWCIFLLIIVFSVFILYNLFSILITNRSKFIGILISLGNDYNSNFFLYFIVIQFVVIIALLLSAILSMIMNEFIMELIGNVLKIEINIDILWYYPIMTYFIFNLFFIFAGISLKHKIKSIEVIDIIKDDD